MAEAYIVEAVRTPVGRRGGGLGAVHPADLGAHVLKALIARADVDPSAVEDVVFGCLDAVGPQAGDIARTCWLAAGLPEEVPGVTVDRQCGSSQQAVHFAAQAVLSGTQDLVVAGGVQNMSMIPIAFATRQAAEPLGLTEGPFAGSEGWRARYGTKPVNQFVGAETIAAKWRIGRREQEEFALRSHRRALRAVDEGRFEREIVPYGPVAVDEGPRRDTSLEKMAALRPVLDG
ncbi:thiolase family protein, partial [Streptomyces nigra]